MPQDTPSPIDMPEAELEESGLGWTLGAIAVASLFLLCANASSLRDWLDDQPPSPLQQQAAELADHWVQIMEGAGIGIPRKAMHEQWKRAEQARFPATDTKKEAEVGVARSN